MRTNLVLSLTLLLSAVSAADTNATTGGSLGKLLERISQQPHDHPDFVGNGTHIRKPGNHTGLRHFKPKTKTASATGHDETAGTVLTPTATAGTDRLVKRIKKAVPNADHDQEKRWVWDTVIIQDDTPSSGLPSAGENANLLSSSAYSVATPTTTPVAPTFTPLSSSAQAAALASVGSVHSSSLKKSLAQHRHPSSVAAPAVTPNKKRWVWGTAIIQDDTPTSGLPAVGANANLLNTIEANTPTASLVAPTFPALTSSAAAAAATSVASVAVNVVAANHVSASGRRPVAVSAGRHPLSARANVGAGGAATPILPKTATSTTSIKTTSTTTSSVKTTSTSSVKTTSTTAKTTPKPITPTTKGKRWVWAASIIQDDSPTSGLPSAGANANLLSSGAADVNTPTASQTAPTFSPESIAVIPVVVNAAATTPAAVVPSSSSLPIRGHRAPSIAHHNLAKKWVWGTSIIQDDSPTSGLPAVGANTNLLNPSIEADTPAATLVAPTFPALSETSTTETVANIASTAVVIAPVVATTTSVVVHRTPTPVATPSVIAALAAGNRVALSRMPHAVLATAIVAKKDNVITVDTLRRLLKEKREANE